MVLISEVNGTYEIICGVYSLFISEDSCVHIYVKFMWWNQSPCELHKTDKIRFSEDQ